MKRSIFQFPVWCLRPVDPAMLALYRIVYGLFMVYTMLNYFRIELVQKMFVEPKINFTYDYLEWLRPLPEPLMNVLIAGLLLCAIAISVGLFFKWSCRFFALGYAYLFLLDKSIYNNHIYLFILLAVLLSLTDADKHFSLRKKVDKVAWVPQWQVLILQAQIVIVYFYGGLAKLTRDWIFNCQPVKVIVEQLPEDQIFLKLLGENLTEIILNYGGLVIDLGAPLFLWYKPVRRWAIFLFIGFNAFNSRIFSDIGIFPYVMLCSLFIFYELVELSWLEKLVNAKRSRGNKKAILTKKYKPEFKYKRAYPYVIGGYFVFQLLFPFRGHFLPNELDWTTIGNRFSWRMKVDTRKIEDMSFYIHSPAFESPVSVEIQTFINDMQIKNMSMDPRSVADFARFLKREALKYNTIEPGITANIKLAYNGRAEQYFVSPEVDLSLVTYSPFTKLDWVIPVDRK